MIYELRTYTLRPGSLAGVVKNSAEVGRRIRGDDCGKLEGYWSTEIGTLNQVIHLWSYPDLNERQRLRAELAKNEAWRQEYLPHLLPHLVSQEVRLMNPALPFKPPQRQGNVYELRCYRIVPGKVREWVQIAVDAMTVREKYSAPLCLWTVEAPNPNEVCHIWPYDDLNARAAVRASVGQDPAWQAVLRKMAPLLEYMTSTVMLPAPHSPLQ